jgi:hypothetical protein
MNDYDAVVMEPCRALNVGLKRYKKNLLGFSQKFQ